MHFQYHYKKNQKKITDVQKYSNMVFFALNFIFYFIQILLISVWFKESINDKFKYVTYLKNHISYDYFQVFSLEMTTIGFILCVTWNIFLTISSVKQCSSSSIRHHNIIFDFGLAFTPTGHCKIHHYINSLVRQYKSILTLIDWWK